MENYLMRLSDDASSSFLKKKEYCFWGLLAGAPLSRKISRDEASGKRISNNNCYDNRNKWPRNRNTERCC